MSYPYSDLTEDETLILHQHSHWKALILPGLAGLLTLGGGSYLAATTASALGQTATLIVVGAMVAALTWFTAAPVVRWQATHFAITDRKIMFREGVVRRASMNIPLGRVQSVRVEADLNDRLFGCGSLIIEAASGEPLTFTDIPHVEHVHTLLYQAMAGEDLTVSAT